MTESAQPTLEPATGQLGGAPRRAPIPTVTVFDPETFVRDYKTPGKPLVIKGGAASWPAVGKWTPEFFATHFGGTQVKPSMNLPDTEVPYQYVDQDFREDMTVADFVRRMGTGERCYIDQIVAGLFDGLDGDYRFEDFQPPDIKDIVFWLGAGTRSGLHYDHVENFFAQICGSKRAILAAPEEMRNLHVFPDSHTKSQVAVEHPDLAKHPRLGLATLLEATLDPGDVLYVPRGWWHYFASSPDSISLACWHDAPMTHADDVKMVLASRNWGLLSRTIRDFFWLGVLGRPYRRRLYSPPPTGLMLHDLVSGLFRRPGKAQ